MRAILFSLLLMIPSGTGNSAISHQGQKGRDYIKQYVVEAVHRIPVDAAMRRVDKVLYTMLTQRVDSLEAAVKLRQR